MQLDVLNKEGKSTGRSVELPDSIFGAEPNDHLIYLAVKQYRAAKHMGNHKVKTRAEANGSSRKLHRQKGTGGSRKGNLRNPLYKGGGTVFGPEPHGYTFKMNKKEKDMARVSALSYKAKDSKIKVVDSLAYDAPKTKDAATLLGNLELTGKRVLFIVDGFQDNFYLSLRNLPKMHVCQLSDTNTHDIVNAHTLVFSEDAAKVFTETPEEEEAVLTEAEGTETVVEKKAPKKVKEKKVEEPKAEETETPEATEDTTSTDEAGEEPIVD